MCSTVKTISGLGLRATFLPDNKHSLSSAHMRIASTYLHISNSPLIEETKLRKPKNKGTIELTKISDKVEG